MTMYTSNHAIAASNRKLFPRRPVPSGVSLLRVHRTARLIGACEAGAQKANKMPPSVLCVSELTVISGRLGAWQFASSPSNRWEALGG